MSEIRIQTVCGFGCGSSLFLRMKIEEVLKKNNIEASVFCGDVGTCLTQPCDAIFISEELLDRIEGRTDVTLVPIVNFTNDEELTTKTLEFIKNLKKQRRVIVNILNFIITEIFGQGAIFLAAIALIGLVPSEEIIQ